MDLRDKLKLWRQLSVLKQETRAAIKNRNQFFPVRPSHLFHTGYQGVDSQSANACSCYAESWKKMLNISNLSLNLSSAAEMDFLYNQAFQQHQLISQYSSVTQKRRQHLNSEDLEVFHHQEEQKMLHQILYSQNGLKQHFESQQLTKPIAPPPSKKNGCRSFDSYRSFLNYKHLHDQESKKIRLEPAQIDINFLNELWPKHLPFYIFGKPETFKFPVFQPNIKLQSHPSHLSELEYDEMRKEFARNGYEELIDVENENEFPPLEKVPERVQKLLSQIFATKLKTLDFNQPKVEVPNIQDVTNRQLINQRVGKNKANYFCVFCQNNKEPAVVYNSHILKDEQGKVLCPRLRMYKCPICGAVGENAHTLHHCPHRRIVTLEDVAKKSPNRQRGNRINFSKN